MYGAYLNNTLIAYSPDANMLDHFLEMGYTVREVLQEDMAKIALEEHRLKQVLITAQMEVSNG